jgi:hypothetical protein
MAVKYDTNDWAYGDKKCVQTSVGNSFKISTRKILGDNRTDLWKITCNNGR